MSDERVSAGEHVISKAELERLGGTEQFRALLHRINHPEEDVEHDRDHEQ